RLDRESYQEAERENPQPYQTPDLHRDIDRTEIRPVQSLIALLEIRLELPDAKEPLVRRSSKGSHFLVDAVFGVYSIAIEIVPQPLAEAVLILSAIQILIHDAQRIFLVRARLPCRILARDQSRSNPASRPVAKITLVVALKLRVIHQPAGLDPLAVAHCVYFSFLGKLPDRCRMTDRIVRLPGEHYQESEGRRQNQYQQCNGKRG